ncbi:MAG TPA: acylphosphatase [Nitrosopumilaceae archaeon]|nr:acylphosphatase [Nitrosopumilaceae archaeon]
MANQRVHIFVKGKVQGVFFRQTTKNVAEKKNVTGWVRNLKDGRVEAVLEGQDINVSEVVEWGHRGPPNAVVEDVQIINEKYKGEFSKFEILY